MSYQYEFNDDYQDGVGGRGNARNVGGANLSAGDVSESSSVTSGWESREGDTTNYSVSTGAAEDEELNVQERIYASRYGGSGYGSSAHGAGANGSGRGGTNSVLASLGEEHRQTGGYGDLGGGGAGVRDSGNSDAYGDRGDSGTYGTENDDESDGDVYSSRYGRESGAYPQSFKGKGITDSGASLNDAGHGGGGVTDSGTSLNDEGTLEEDYAPHTSLGDSLERNAGDRGDVVHNVSTDDYEPRDSFGNALGGEPDDEEAHRNDSEGWEGGFKVSEAGATATGAAAVAQDDDPFSPFPDVEEEEDAALIMNDDDAAETQTSEAQERYPSDTNSLGKDATAEEADVLGADDDDVGYGDKLLDDATESQQVSYFGSNHGAAEGAVGAGAVAAGAAGVAVAADPEDPEQGIPFDGATNKDFDEDYADEDGDKVGYGNKFNCGGRFCTRPWRSALCLLILAVVGGVVAAILFATGVVGSSSDDTAPSLPITDGPTETPTTTMAPTTIGATTSEPTAAPVTTPEPPVGTVPTTPSPTTPTPTEAPATGPTTAAPTPTSTPPPTVDERTSEIYNLLLPGSGVAALNDTSSPQYQAMGWISNVDGLQLNPETQSDWIVQRHALATLYYATEGQESWMNGANFLTDDPECDWNSNDVGITACQNDGTMDRATRVDLHSNNLFGTLPKELSLLANLQSLDLGTNFLVGELPSEMGDLASLEELRLDTNAFKDKLPSRWRRMSSLVTLDLSGNELTGSIIPAILNSWTSMQTLLLNDNTLTGNLPSTLQNMQALKVLRMNDNRFTGTVPDIFQNNFQVLDNVLLDGNDVVGTINFCDLPSVVTGGDGSGNFTSDCLAEFDGTGAEITECLCCTQCCNELSGCVDV